MAKNYVHSFMCIFPGQTVISHQQPVDFYYLPQCEEVIQQGLQTGKNWIDFIARNHGNAFNKTRLHSSRMRTARALTVSHSMLGGGGVSARGGVCSQRGRGCLLRGVGWGCLLPGCCVCSRGCLLLGG